MLLSSGGFKALMTSAAETGASSERSASWEPLFLALAAYVADEAMTTLLSCEAREGSIPGIVIFHLSLCPFLLGQNETLLEILEAQP